MLNDAQLRAAKPRQKPYEHFDAHRLYLLVNPRANGMRQMRHNRQRFMPPT